MIRNKKTSEKCPILLDKYGHMVYTVTNNKDINKENIMNTKKTYQNTGIKITKIPMKKTTSKNIVSSRAKRSVGWREPTSVKISSIYNSNDKAAVGATKHDAVSTNKQAHSREFGAQ